MGLPTDWAKDEANVACYQRVSDTPWEDTTSLEGYKYAGSG